MGDSVQLYSLMKSSYRISNNSLVGVQVSPGPMLRGTKDAQPLQPDRSIVGLLGVILAIFTMPFALIPGRSSDKVRTSSGGGRKKLMSRRGSLGGGGGGSGGGSGGRRSGGRRSGGGGDSGGGSGGVAGGSDGDSDGDDDDHGDNSAFPGYVYRRLIPAGRALSVMVLMVIGLAIVYGYLNHEMGAEGFRVAFQRFVDSITPLGTIRGFFQSNRDVLLEIAVHLTPTQSPVPPDQLRDIQGGRENPHLDADYMTYSDHLRAAIRTNSDTDTPSYMILNTIADSTPTSLFHALHWILLNMPLGGNPNERLAGGITRFHNDVLLNPSGYNRVIREINTTAWGRVEAGVPMTVEQYFAAAVGVAGGGASPAPVPAPGLAPVPAPGPAKGGAGPARGGGAAAAGRRCRRRTVGGGGSRGAATAAAGGGTVGGGGSGLGGSGRGAHRAGRPHQS
jgi:hypothetical protein